MADAGACVRMALGFAVGGPRRGVPGRAWVSGAKKGPRRYGHCVVVCGVEQVSSTLPVPAMVSPVDDTCPANP